MMNQKFPGEVSMTRIDERPILDKLRYRFQSAGYSVRLEHGKLLVFKETRSVTPKELREFLTIQDKRLVVVIKSLARFTYVVISEKSHE